MNKNDPTNDRENKFLKDPLSEIYSNKVPCESIKDEEVNPIDKISEVKNGNEEKKSQKYPKLVYILTFISTVGGYLFGYDTGVVSGALLLLKSEFKMTSVQQEIFVSITMASAGSFAIVGGIVNNLIGRKPTILIAISLFFISSIGLSLAFDFISLAVWRFLVGVAIGLSSSTVPMYIAESAPRFIRGSLASVNIINLAAGLWSATIVCGIFSNVRHGWRYMLGFASIPSIILLIGFCFMPESPRWLYINGHKDEAEVIFHKIMGSREEVNDEIIEMEKLLENQDDHKCCSAISMLRHAHVRRALLIGVMLQITQQMCGINGILYYCATIIIMSGVQSNSKAIWLSSAVVFSRFVFSLASFVLIDRLGRKILFLASLGGVIVCLFILAIGFQISDQLSPLSMNHKQISPSICDSPRNCKNCLNVKTCGFCFSPHVNNGMCLPADVHKIKKDNDSAFAVCKLNGKMNKFYETNLVSNTMESINNTINSPVEELIWSDQYCPSKYSWMTMTGMILFMMCFAPGVGPVPWAINSEIYPTKFRSLGNSITASVNWFTNLFVSLSFLTLTELITKQGVFYLYAGCSLFGWIFFLVILPETKYISLEKMEVLFTGSWLAFGKSKKTPFQETEYESLK